MREKKRRLKKSNPTNKKIFFLLMLQSAIVVVAALGICLLQPLGQLVPTAVVLALDDNAPSAHPYPGYVASVL